jgi:beta-1,4-mannosyl-glycoprotein beta-1,4-N-acetylglucosaminyltransferase
MNVIKRKIVDCFIFYDELDMLDYRFHLLNEVVDLFMIVESTHSHKGLEKPLIFQENRDRFKAFESKILHVVVEDTPYPNANVKQNEQWKNENHHRNRISVEISKLGLLPEDIFTITDLDELPDPSTLYQIKHGKIPVTIHCLEMDMYYYNLRTKQKTRWYHPKICRFGSFQETGLSAENIRMSRRTPLSKGGWHLSYFGDKYFIQRKIVRCLHEELELENHSDLSTIERRMLQQEDLYGRKGLVDFENVELKENPYLPEGYDVFLPDFL